MAFMWAAKNLLKIPCPNLSHAEQQRSIKRLLAHANGEGSLSFASNKLASMFQCFDRTESKPILTSVLHYTQCQFTWDSIFDVLAAVGCSLVFSFFLSLFFLFIASIQPFSLVFYSNDKMWPFWRNRCKDASMCVWCLCIRLSSNGTDINKWYVVDASLKHPFSITSIHYTQMLLF